MLLSGFEHVVGNQKLCQGEWITLEDFASGSSNIAEIGVDFAVADAVEIGHVSTNHLS